MKSICLIVSFLLMLAMSSSSANADCIFSQILVGEIKVARIRIDGYNSLILTSRREINGVHPRSIIAELTEERWGYDIDLPNGERVGQLNLDPAPSAPNPELSDRYEHCNKNELSIATAILLKAVPAKFFKKIW